MSNNSFCVQVKNGVPDFGNDIVKKNRIKNWFAVREGKTIEIRDITHKRSNQQSRFYWLYLGVIENETGNTASDLHELFKRKFLPPQTKIILGQTIKLPASTTNLSKHDFSEYMEKICAESGVPIPDPKLAGYVSNHASIEKVEKVENYDMDYKEPLI